MTTSAKRLGMAQGGMELEQRLRRIEQEIEKKADANINTGVSSRSRLIPIQITGLDIVGGIQAWRISWDPVYASDLAKYEVHISDTITFNTFTVYDVTTNYFEYTQEPDPLEDVPLPNYVRVRAVTLVGYSGLFSRTLDVTTGKLTTADFTAGAVTQYVEWEQTAGLYQLEHGDGLTDPYTDVASPWNGQVNPYTTQQDQLLGPITISTHSEGIVMPYLSMELELQSFTWLGNASPNNLLVEVRRRVSGGADTTISSMYYDYFYSIPWSKYYLNRDWGGAPYNYRYKSTMTCPLEVPLIPDQPGEGIQEYRIYMKVTSTLAATVKMYLLVWPKWIKFRLLEFRR
jgi:hypothetical protein